MIQFIFTKSAKKTFQKLPAAIRDRIITKLKELKNHSDIFSTLKKLHHFSPATHRLRIGDYRIILELQDYTDTHTTFLILDLGSRKDIYN
ncbi:type II toxin-antitoxin system RelE/ParE family toxin [Candidatus Peregrinibacteria bacterium HGW-Peregrinibacteria-1]|jgi:mRNA-degrading endonuclease RelE of RelBE toxin-antitoxin system|nr:MAG: type II toxin-antitoxin system RelE/ParE family toxin [Candidatus Peregrinibacteria bacterium HGW-Peregrinibacteria-1]